MDISGEDLNILASIIANIISCDMSIKDLVTMRLLISQINCCLGTIINQNLQKNDKKSPKNHKN